MKKLIDYKEEIHKCSKCGLCQSVCPVYKVTGNDCSVSRGKFIMLNGIIKGDLKLNKNINKYLDMCLKCNACKDFCPSDIDARRIFLTAKAEYFESFDNRADSKFVRILNSAPVFNLCLNLAKIGGNAYRLLKMDKLAKKIYFILQKSEFGKKAVLINEFLTSQPLNFSTSQPKPCVSHLSPLTIIYFKGCVNEYINPRTKIATEEVLAKIGVKTLPIKFQCCGVPFLSNGNVEQFKKQAIFNLSQIPDDFDFFLTDCASCKNAFKEYKNYIDDEKLLKKIDIIIEKSVNVNEFIVKNLKSIEFSEKISFTFHKPCHLENTDFLNELLAKSKNIEYIKMKDFDKCCGFSGEFALKNPEISKQISAQKVQNAIETKADYILTSCPACVLGLTQGLIEKTGNKKQATEALLCNKSANHSTIQLFNLSTFIEFISLADKIY